MPSGIATLGATPTTIEYVELYTSVERGVIDGLLYPPGMVIMLKINEVTSYAIGNPIGVGDVNIIMNLDKFNSLPEHLQDLLREVGEEEEASAEAYFNSIASGNIELLKESGIEFINFTGEDEDFFLEHLYEGEWEAVIEHDPDVAPKLMELAYERGNWPVAPY